LIVQSLGELRAPLNICMMKARLSPNLISFFLVRRGNWVLKVSVFKNKQILVLMQHIYDMDRFIMQYFQDQNAAADFIEHMVQDI
jgi:hypothetical protein